MLISAAHKVPGQLKIDSQSTKRERNTLLVAVRDNNVDQALRVLKKKMQREGLFREMKKTVVRSKSHLSVGPVKPPNRPAVSES